MDEAAGNTSSPEAVADANGDVILEPSQIDLAVRSIRGYARAAQWLAPYVPLYLATESASSRGEEWDPKGRLAREWRVQHRRGASDMSDFIKEMQGFYVKVGQLIATRVDLFPDEYSKKLSFMVDSVNPLPFEVVRQVIEEELLEGYPLDEVFESVDSQPLGSASIAQVHRAKLKNGKDVAVKVQRPNVEAQLLDDIAVIKNLAKQLQGIFPVDYYAVFTELEDQLKEEFDFCLEAFAMDRIAAALSREGSQAVFIPRSVPGLVSRRVLVMDFVPGLSLAQAEKQSTDERMNSRVVKQIGRRILASLTEAFGRMILEEGFFHADPHPGNVYIMPDYTPALIDFGQVKRIGYKFRRELAELVLLIANNKDTRAEYMAGAKLGQRMGLKFSEEAHEYCPVALGLYVMDWSRTELPGGYSASELSPRNVMKDVVYFPREWVLTCRAMQLLRGLAERLDVEWALPERWREHAMRALGRSANSADAAVPKGFWPQLKRWWNVRARQVAGS
eukprot:TRINITY_DN32924_c0_g1_i1.p1 TRINITY_DN32924_c0_g1~~TRINITY_DN32924_c0_g1_i1.p1  ORF type:complete len:587 (+),score=127.91 TRINITY_DN32924_c0_g1_i1:249-1763(+)